MRIAATVSSVLLLSACAATASLAAWPTPPYSSVPVCTAAGEQNSPSIAGDGVGGAFVAWQDNRGIANYISVQHLRASDGVDPAWPVNGLAMGAVNLDQRSPKVVADGTGGAIVVWEDYRSGAHGIYAGHVLASGSVDLSWPENGRALCTSGGGQFDLLILADGAGGALVAWTDLRTGNYDIYAHHILANGTTDPAVPANGRAVCTAAGNQFLTDLASDGAGGALASWSDLRGGATSDSYVGHLMPSSALDPAWPSSGLAICALAGNQFGGKLLPDDAGGALVVWDDQRSGRLDIYVQHVLGNGVVDPAWPANGRAICMAADDQRTGGMVTDGAGGAIITWTDARYSTANDFNRDVYAQHVLVSGVVDPGWPANGLELDQAPFGQYDPVAVPDGAGGALVVWGGYHPSSYNLYVQRLYLSCTVDRRWPVDGQPVDTPTARSSPQQWRAISDGFGSMIVTWSDSRDWLEPGYSGANIYAQRITPPDGVVAALASLVSARWTGAAAEIVWQGDALAGAQVAVYREEDRAGWAQVATVTGDGEGFARFTDPGVAAGREYGYRLGMPLDGAEVLVGETRIAIPAGGLAIQAVSPNPARGGRLGLRATFAGSEPARARVLDLSGRIVLEREVATGSGGAELDLGGASLRPGVYVLELVQGGSRATARFTYLK